MRALSLDLRQRIVAARDAGQTQTQIAKRFDVSQATVSRIHHQWDQTHSLNPKPRPGRVPRIAPSQLPKLDALVTSKTTWILRDLVDAWQEQTGERLSLASMHRHVVKCRLTHKKSAASPPSATSTSGLPSERQ